MRASRGDAASTFDAVTPAPPDAVPARWIFSLALLGSVVLSAGISAQTYLSMLGHGHSFVAILLWQMSCWSVWALVAPIIVRAAGSLAHAPRPWLRLGMLGAVCVAGHVALAAQLALWFQPYVPVTDVGYRQAFVRQLSVLPVDLLAYGTLLLSGWALAVSRLARRLEVRESSLEAELAKAQLEALRLEIQPHFLFNTLNAISALIRRKANDRALEMLLGLSELMRHTLERTNDPLTTLDAEMDFTKRYVDLQQARFADRLDVAYRIGDDCRALGVPTFVLQPLVENAIRHGMGREGRRCRLEVGARLERDRLHLWVSDDGVGVAPTFDLERDARTGLGNTRSRLERLYGRAAQLRVAARDGGGTVAAIVVPARAMVVQTEATA
ncbi:MAG TPA: histidine kinase [Vicinamibacterales bacterium]|jgi:signal transduction histidine kinase